MTAENPTWGVPRIHGEIQKLGLEVSERTVSRSMPTRPAHPDARQRWRIFLADHREVIAAMGFLTVPTVTFRVLHVFFVVRHARRTPIHVRVTGHPTAAWIMQQLREAFPYDQAPRTPILHRDAKYGREIPSANWRMGIDRKQFTARSPWQSGVAERFASTAGRDLLDPVIALDEKRRQRLLACFASYTLDDRTHLSPKTDSPAMGTVETKPYPAAEGDRQQREPHPVHQPLPRLEPSDQLEAEHGAGARHLLPRQGALRVGGEPRVPYPRTELLDERPGPRGS